MEIMKSVTGEIMKDLEGNILVSPSIPPIVLEHEDIQFPPNLNPVGTFSVRSSGFNTIYIDFGDESPIFHETFSGLKTYPVLTPIHTYADTSRKFVKVWFEFPQRITSISFTWLYLTGNFPISIGLYDLDDLSFRQTRFDMFPEEFRGGVFRTLRLQNITRNIINSIPSWITSSRVTNLILSDLDLSNTATSNLNKIIDIQGLTNLDLIQTNFTNIPANFKDISTLRLLGLGNNPITEITSEINACKQLRTLSIGYRINASNSGSSLFTSWGVGVSNMPNLQRFEWNYMINAPTTLPTGIETAPNCKTLWARGAYRTQERTDEFFENTLSKVELEASMTVGNTLLRRVTFRMDSINLSIYSLRPSGIYKAPSGYIQGVSNGTPASPMECIYILVNQYEWIITLVDEAGTGSQTYAP